MTRSFRYKPEFVFWDILSLILIPVGLGLFFYGLLQEETLELIFGVLIAMSNLAVLALKWLPRKGVLR